MHPYLAEFVGTTVLILFGVGVNAGVNLSKSYGHQSGWIITTLGWGLAVTFAVYSVGHISGAHLNPAVTVGLAAAGQFPWSDVLGYVVGQLLGGIFGGFLVWLQFLPHWKATQEESTKLGVFCTAPAIPSRFANLLSEIIGTFAFLFALSYLGATHFSDGLNPLVIGALIVLIGMALGNTTGYAINPARDLGPRLAHFFLPIAGKGHSSWSYSWIPVIGPLIGGVLGTTLHQALFHHELISWFYMTLSITIFIAVMAVREQKKI